jgi:hypothetical protein
VSILSYQGTEVIPSASTTCGVPLFDYSELYPHTLRCLDGLKEPLLAVVQHFLHGASGLMLG